MGVYLGFVSLCDGTYYFFTAIADIYLTRHR